MLIFEDLVHPLVRKLFLHLKEAIKSVLYMPVPGNFHNNKKTWFKLGQN